MAQKESDSGRLQENTASHVLGMIPRLQGTPALDPSTLESMRREKFGEDGVRLPQPLSTRSIAADAARQDIVDVGPGEPQEGKANIGR